MKFNWKRLAALMLAVVLMLSLTGMGEEEITIAGDTSANAAEIEDVLSIDGTLVEPDELLDDSLELNLSNDILNTFEESTIEQSDIADPEAMEQEATNASDWYFSPWPFTYLPRKTLTSTAAATMISAAAE